MLVDFALPKNIEKLRTDLEKYRITYDVWFPESTLHQSGAVKAVVDELTSRGMTYEKDGAIWYKATEFGGEKDEVLGARQPVTRPTSPPISPTIKINLSTATLTVSSTSGVPTTTATSRA